MLAIEPDERPTAKEAMNHPWFLDQMTLEEKKHHMNLQRQQANILKIHELYIFLIFILDNLFLFTICCFGDFLYYGYIFSKLKENPAQSLQKIQIH